MEFKIIQSDSKNIQGDSNDPQVIQMSLFFDEQQLSTVEFRIRTAIPDY